MATIVATLAMLHVAALAGVLLMARYSVMLVDDEGRPIRPGTWHERVVAPQEVPSRLERR